jgi:peroxiredoxin (alkyl hydroperoxide reductase subunit C)
VGVSCDSWAALKAWSKQEGYDIPLLSDLHRTVCKAYGLYWTDLNVSQRGTVIVGKDGKVRWSQARQPGNAFKKEEVEAALR